jgi:hypothetical protein
VNASFSWRGVDYEVSGWLWSDDGDRNGMIVRRADGAPIRGVKMHPGMIQTGRSDGLDRAARRALESAREAEREDA